MAESRISFKKMIRAIGELPFRKRIWFAWRIVKGVK